MTRNSSNTDYASALAALSPTVTYYSATCTVLYIQIL